VLVIDGICRKIDLHTLLSADSLQILQTFRAS
jgi:hypothetical protein